MKDMSVRQRWNLGAVAVACVGYLVLSATAPQSTAPSPYHFSIWLVLLVSITVIGLLLLAWVLGFYAWLELDRYTHRLPAGAGRQAFGRMAQGMWFLAVGLIVSSTITAAKPFYGSNSELAAVVGQFNYYVIVIFPFLGFLKLRTGSRHMAVAAQAAMTTQAKLITVGPPVALLAAFYVFLAVTNSTPDAKVLMSGPIGFLALPASIFFTIGAWVFGLLAAMNVERATYRGEGASHSQPLVKLYNGILTTTGGFIILDALLSLGSTRLGALPVGVILLLLYAFIGVVALGFLIVARGARELLAVAPSKARG